MQHPREILEHAHAYIAAQGFFYPKQTIANLYLSLKTKPFVILAGVSGTGKTQLIRQFAAALGHADRVSHIPVRPTWQDHTDLFGYTDLQDRFIPRAFLSALYQAAQAPEWPHFVLLDEMNLARVEHYFSDVLSIMETRRWDQGQLISDPFFSAQSFPTQNDSNAHWVGFGLPDNVYLIGTINMDESTQSLSRKVLDRANVMEMNEVFLDLPLEEEEAQALAPVSNTLLRSPFIYWKDVPSEARPAMEKALRWIIDIHSILKEADQPLAYRLRDEVLFYMYHRIEIRELLSESEALDRQVNQKILPRLQGNSRRLIMAVYQLIGLLSGSEDFPDTLISYSELKQLIQGTLQERHPFHLSIQRLLLMYRRYEEDGYISYWM